MSRLRGDVEVRHNPLFTESLAAHGLDRSGPSWSAVGELKFANPAFRADPAAALTPWAAADVADALAVLDSIRADLTNPRLARAMAAMQIHTGPHASGSETDSLDFDMYSNSQHLPRTPAAISLPSPSTTSATASEHRPGLASAAPRAVTPSLLGGPLPGGSSPNLHEPSTLKPQPLEPQQPHSTALPGDDDVAYQPRVMSASERSLDAATALSSDKNSVVGHISDALPEAAVDVPCANAPPAGAQLAHASGDNKTVLVRVHAGGAFHEAEPSIASTREPAGNVPAEGAPKPLAAGAPPIAGMCPSTHSTAAPQCAAAKAVARQSTELGFSCSAVGSAESLLPASDTLNEGSKEQRKTRRGRGRGAYDKFKKAVMYLLSSHVEIPPGANVPAGFDGYSYNYRIFG